MGRITADQSQQVMAILMTNVDWSSIDFEESGLQDAVIRNGKEAGDQFTRFLKNRGRVIVGDPKSFFTTSFDPAEFIGKEWKVWRGPIDGDGLSGEEDIDPRSLGLTEINVASLLFETCLKKGEQRITGEEKLKRLKAANVVRLGGNVFLGLWRDFETNKENSILEHLYRTRKITYLDFFGFILRRPDGRRCVLDLYRDDGGEWIWGYGWLGRGWSAGDRSAVLADKASDGDFITF